MASTLIVVRDHIGWGKLVKSWALGENLLQPGSPPPPIPRDLAEFRRICHDDYKIDMDIPENLGFAVALPGQNVFILKLPPRDKLRESHATLGSLEAYPIPKFYNVAYGVPELIVHGMSIEDFHACRVGDYTLSFCG
jgi:hypothetical protein